MVLLDSLNKESQSAALNLISSTHFGDYFLQLAVMRLLLTCDIPRVVNEPFCISSPMFQINSVNVKAYFLQEVDIILFLFFGLIFTQPDLAFSLI